MAEAPPPSSTPRAAELAARVGTIVGQRYKLLSLLGEGGMAAVYLADDVTLGKRVALKLLKAEHATDPQVLARFDREAKAMTVLVHPHIVPALGFGRSPEGDMCLVMELVEGETLRAALQRIKPFPPHGVVEIAGQIAAGLACAHGFGVVHRDFKPENVMLTWLPGNRPWIKILDFGMARILVGSTGTPLTRKGAIFGTPEYMPPEQAMGQPVDARADQYAFGVIVFEMLAGKRPFKAKTALEMVQMQIRMPPPPLTDLVPGLPPAAAAVVDRMLAKRADDRFPDVVSASAALAQALLPAWGPRV
jgi:eukaryotic-like serine/threonine-protein kinase